VPINKTRLLKLVNCEIIPTPTVPNIIANIFVLNIPVSIFVADARESFDTAEIIFLIVVSQNFI
jgi:hypothetical protein